ncbi:MAG: DEAD/DEAH box helicase [Propionibacterium sp.]|nr:DEAD/DEAH box helicase [Propionibacterium sp.]
MIIPAAAAPEGMPALFTAPTRQWFTSVFDRPTPVQEAAWQVIDRGESCLVVAPTGSGKTLAAFLHSIDRLSVRGATAPAQAGSSAHRGPSAGAGGRPGVSVLYVSPLKALAVDVERNLRAPLRGIGFAAARLGLPIPEIGVAVRSGDTPANERRRILTHPPDVLITTPESLFLMLSSRAVEVLRDVHTVILDEVHALAGTKRGAHLMVSIERLQALNPDRPIQRIALSATVNPVDRVAAFVGGTSPVTIVAPPTHKTWNLSIEVPVPDLTDLRSPADPDDPNAATTQSVWPFLESRLLELVSTHRSTICFVNSRRVAERVTSHLNERWRDLNAPNDQQSPDPDDRESVRPPAEVLAQSGMAGGHSAGDIARAHHGSVSKERRAAIEADLKSGALRCVVATSALELGIDMGAVDLVIQVQSPPSVASGLQRIGRAGHQVGAVSSGVILPAHRSDLLEAVVVADRMIAGRIESVSHLANPLDVLAQQIVSICLQPGHTAHDVFDLVRRTDPYRDLPWSAFEAVLEMLSGRYPSEDFAELRPRLTWDRATGLLEARPGARRLVTTSGGTIPDRGLFGVFLPAGDGPGAAATGRRVGELDEEMVYESRVGDVFTLGTSSWRIREITPNQVIVTPAPGQVSRLPFWHGDQPARPMELGRAIAGFIDEVSAMPPAEARSMLQRRGLDVMAADNLLAYLADQRAATGVVPGARTIVVERFRDELGDWRLCLHAPLGTAVLSPWALAIEAAARERYGVDAHASATNDGIIVRIPDIESTPPGVELVAFDGDDLEGIVTRELSGSALFAARFRECAGRALLLPRRDPARRSPLWQQRMRAAQLLSVAAGHPQFPIVLETMRECLHDVFDLPALRQVLDDIAARRVRLVEVETGQPSPFARSLLFGYVGEFIYDGDQPLAERRVAALSLDPALLSELLGREGGDALFDLDVAGEVERELQGLDGSHRAFSAESLWDLIRTVGPLTRDECVQRSEPGADVDGWLSTLSHARRVAGTMIRGVPVMAVADDHALLRDALGIPVPQHVATGPRTDADEALGRLLLRWLLTHVVVTPRDLADRYGVPASVGEQALSRLVTAGVAVRLDDDTARRHGAVVHRQVLQRVRRRTLARLRAGIEPVEPGRLAEFLAEWHELDDPADGPDALLTAVELLAGYPLPASMLESMVLPARVSGYHPALLDQALASGEIVWSGQAPIGRSDGWVQLWPADAVLASPAGDEPTAQAAVLLAHLRSGGAWTLHDLCTATGVDPAAAADALWELVWAGRITSDTFVAVRAMAASGALRTPRRPQHRRRVSLRVPTRTPIPAAASGRWTAIAEPPAGDTDRAVLAAQLVLGRHGVVLRGSVAVEPLFGTWTDAYRTLSALEDAGAVRRGYFIDGGGAAQFAVPGAVDRLRADASSGHLRLLAACDPANPFGAAIPWPDTGAHRPSRRAGALVVLDDHRPVIWLERGVHAAVTFGADDEHLVAAFDLIARAAAEGRLPGITIDRIDQRPVLEDPRGRDILGRAGFAMTPQGFRVRPHRAPS